GRTLAADEESRRDLPVRQWRLRFEHLLSEVWRHKRPLLTGKCVQKAKSKATQIGWCRPESCRCQFRHDIGATRHHRSTVIESRREITPTLRNWLLIGAARHP